MSLLSDFSNSLLSLSPSFAHSLPLFPSFIFSRNFSRSLSKSFSKFLLVFLPPNTVSFPLKTNRPCFPFLVPIIIITQTSQLVHSILFVMSGTTMSHDLLSWFQQLVRWFNFQRFILFSCENIHYSIKNFVLSN